MRRVIERLNRQNIGGESPEMIPLLWEDSVPAQMGQGAQESVDYYLGQAGLTDIFVCIFWTKLGGPAIVHDRRYASGTLYEFESAYAGLKRTGSPRILLYRCTRPHTPEADATATEVRAFFVSLSGEGARYVGLPFKFSTEAEFEQRVESDLRSLIIEILAERARVPLNRSRERTTLVRGVQEFLDRFEDLFGEGQEKSQLFQISMRAVDENGAIEEGPSRPTDGSSILSVYEQWGRRILLLGDPGAGKTFAMLALMSELLSAARQRDDRPIPVYFNLASWVKVRLSQQSENRRFWERVFYGSSSRPELTFDAWVIDELSARYAIPRRAAERLVHNRQLVLCVDGLDELASDDPLAVKIRSECVAAVNATLEDRSVQMIFCARWSTYNDLVVRPRLGRPLALIPLTPGQISTYLKDWPRLDGLRAALAESPLLRGRAEAPLFLRLMATSYRDVAKDEILTAVAGSPDHWEKHLLDNYVTQCMSVAQPSLGAYTRAIVGPALRWIASLPSNEFAVEDIQPSLLGVKKGAGEESDYKAYRRLSVAALTLVTWLTTVAPVAAGSMVEWTVYHGATAGVMHAMRFGAVASAVAISFAWIGLTRQKWWSFGIWIGVGFALVRSLAVGMSPREGGTGGTLAEAAAALAVSVPCAVAVFLLFGFQTFGRIDRYRQRYASRPGIDRYEIQPLETLDWRWFDKESRWRGGWLGPIFGSIVGLLLWLGFGAARGIGFGVIVTLVVTLFSGFSNTSLIVSLSPNQGIVRSGVHATIMAILLAISGVVAFGLSYGLKLGWVQGVVNGVMGMVLLFTFLVFGGIPVIRHCCLGMVLHGQGVLPSWRCWPPWRKTIAFLEDMVRFKLLRHTAGAYMFRHEILRQFFRRQER